MADDYELLDAGGGRKCERFGAVTVVRPAPAAGGAPRLPPETWAEADAEFVGRPAGGEWRVQRGLPEPWTCRWGARTYHLEATPTGQVGWFPEQEPLRDHVGGLLSAAAARTPDPQVLDLFAYTGGTTLASLSAGAHVTWVDAARRAATWAKRNVEANALDAHRVRWIVDDVPKFVAREVRRGASYHGIALDPPSFGRGPRGSVFEIDRDLGGLLGACAQLLADDAVFLLVSTHSETWTMADLDARGRAVAGRWRTRSSRLDLALTAASGVRLPSGHAILWEFA
jgi:23S rRNA (cytosine1962-C5)-methyltransferase